MLGEGTGHFSLHTGWWCKHMHVAHTCACTGTCTSTHMYAHACTHTWVNTHAHTHTHTSTHRCTTCNTHTLTCAHVCMCTCTHAYTHTHTHTHTHILSLHPHHLLPSVQCTLEIALSGPTWMATTVKWLYRPLCTPSLSPSLATTSTGQTGRCVSGLESAEVYLIHLSWQSSEIAFNNNSTKCVKSTCTQVHT